MNAPAFLGPIERMKRPGSILAYVVALTLLCASARGSGRSALAETGRLDRQPLLSAPVFSPTGEIWSSHQPGAVPRVVHPELDRGARFPVTKYRHVPTAAAGVHIGRIPAFDRKGYARLNRFVFRRAPSAAPAAPTSAAAIGGARAGER